MPDDAKAVEELSRKLLWVIRLGREVQSHPGLLSQACVAVTSVMIRECWRKSQPRPMMSAVEVFLSEVSVGQMGKWPGRNYQLEFGVTWLETST